jgi:hypothetical protein
MIEQAQAYAESQGLNVVTFPDNVFLVVEDGEALYGIKPDPLIADRLCTWDYGCSPQFEARNLESVKRSLRRIARG